MRKNLATLVGICSLWLGGGCGQSPTNVEAVEQASAVSSSNGLSASLSLQPRSGGAFCASLSIANSGPTAVVWNLTLDIKGATLESAWDGTFVPSGSELRVGGASSNASLEPGGATTVGLCLNGGAAAPELVSVVAAGEPTMDSATVDAASGDEIAEDFAPELTAAAASSGPCPAGITKTITVAKDGSGSFSSVQAAINSVANGSTARIRIDIKAGTYTEKVTIANRSNLCLVGADAKSTILSYRDANATAGSTSGSASVLISADDFSAANLTFQNTYGAGSQAVALRTTGKRQQFLNCRFVGYQDTLYTHSGTQYFKNCYVQGNTDFVFGGATAILDNCEVRNVAGGSAVAAPNTGSSTSYGIVFLGGKFTAASGVSGVALGRPWGSAGAAAYLNANLGAHIRAEGFVTMSGNDPRNARFREYNSSGSGAKASSRSSYQMSSSEAAKYTVANIFGGSWTPSYSQ